MVTRSHGLLTMSLEEVYRELFVTKSSALINFGVREKLGYFNEILKMWAADGKFPRNYDVKDESEVVVLGE
jgi:hypothetical protein